MNIYVHPKMQDLWVLTSSALILIQIISFLILTRRFSLSSPVDDSAIAGVNRVASRVFSEPREGVVRRYWWR